MGYVATYLNIIEHSVTRIFDIPGNLNFRITIVSYPSDARLQIPRGLPIVALKAFAPRCSEAAA